MTGGDEPFAQLVLARIIEPVSELDSLRVLEDAGAAPTSYRTVMRQLKAPMKVKVKLKRSSWLPAAPGRLTASWRTAFHPVPRGRRCQTSTS